MKLQMRGDLVGVEYLKKSDKHSTSSWIMPDSSHNTGTILMMNFIIRKGAVNEN